MTTIRGIWKSEFFRNVATLISGTTLAQAFSVLIYVVLGRIYSEHDFGVFGLYMNILNIAVIFSTGKYELAILLPRQERDAINLTGLSGLISALLAALLWLIIIPLHAHIGQWLGSEELSSWLFLLPLSVLLVGWFTALRNFSNREKRYRLIAGANISQSLMNSLVKLGLGLLAAGAAGLIFGAVIGQLTGLGVFLALHLLRNREKLSWLSFSEMKRLAREYSLFPRFNMWQGLINNLSAAFPVILLSIYFTTDDAGLFTFGFMVVHRPVNLVAGSFYQVMYQRFVEKAQKGQPLMPEIRIFLLRMSLVLAPVFILFGVFSPEVFAFVFDEKWYEAGKYVRYLLPWIFSIALVMPLSFIPDLYKRQARAMIIDGFRLVLRLLGLLVGVIQKDVYLAVMLYGAASAGMTFFSLSWYLYLVHRKQGEALDKSKYE